MSSETKPTLAVAVGDIVRFHDVIGHIHFALVSKVSAQENEPLYINVAYFKRDTPNLWRALSVPPKEHAAQVGMYWEPILKGGSDA